MQFKYFIESGIFTSQEDAAVVYEELKQMIADLEKSAESGNKYDLNGNVTLEETGLTLYHSEIEIGNNTIFVNIANHKSLYLTVNTLNKMRTQNEVFCNETECWIRGLIKKSTLLSGVAEKQRYQFFKTIYKQLEELKHLIADY